MGKQNLQSTHKTMNLEYTYSNGVVSPAVHLGTYRTKTQEDVRTSVVTALRVGYRGIDTAEVYRNQCKIGQVLADIMPSLGINRQNLFITSKLHPKDPHNKKLRLESWKILEENYKNRRLHSIGVSNFTLSHMKELIENCEIVPHVLQIELHPHYQQRELVGFCHTQGIHVQAYSSLGQEGVTSPLFNSDVVKKVSSCLGKTPAQVLLGWGLQKGFTVMPKSVHPERIQENINTDFEIPSDYMEMLDDIEKTVVEKYAWDPSTVA